MKRKYLYRLTCNTKVKKVFKTLHDEFQIYPFDTLRKTRQVFLDEAQLIHSDNLEMLKAKAYIKITDMIYFKKVTAKEIILKLNRLNKIFRFSKNYLYHDFLSEFLLISRFNKAIKNNEIHKYKTVSLYQTYSKKYKNIQQFIDHILNCLESKSIEVGSRETFYEYMIYNDLDYTNPLTGAGDMFLEEPESCLL